MYTQISYWKEFYARDDYPDQRAVADFVTVEMKEVLSAFRGEIIGISQGNFVEENLIGILGRKRLAKHGSFDVWAQMMLQWITIAARQG